ncbi:MAG TPA: bifunctional indole-3-glycerol-phosphate synthase TrpC/phosphoribosylanthranilate isomerase TrpF [Vicinamibacteria bacterium]
MSQSSILDRIVGRTRESVLERRRTFPIDRMQRSAPTPTGRRPFLPAVSRPGQVNIIAEFKRRSPSRGVIREDLHPVSVAQAYEVAGACALSILTEEQFFGGSLDDLREARAATLLPALRKDFVVDPYQVWEAWYAGADAVLLIVAALSDGELRTLHQTAQEVGVEALVEVHDERELARALKVGARLVGVNSRDLRTMTVRLETALELAERIPDDVVAVAESGIRGPGDVRRLRDAGYDAFLIGEHLMLQSDPGAALEELVNESQVQRWPGRAARQGSRVAVKICGITSVEDGLMAARAGADAVGLVFWPKSPRAVELETARRIAAALPPFVLRVGVFVDAERETMARIADAVGLDVLQLHGDEPPPALAGLPRRAIKAVRVGAGFDPQDALRYEGHAHGILLDTKVEGGAPGGTGQAFDWTQVRAVREGASFLMLAGGLDAENVRRALTAVRPDAVDVSSGVESAPGRKDAAKVRAFIEAVRGVR